MRRLVLFVIAALLLTSIPASDISPDSRTSSMNLRSAAVGSFGHISDSMGELLFSEEFQSPSLGFNNSNWNLTRISNPSLFWIDDEKTQLSACLLGGSVLTAMQVFNRGVIADVSFSCSLGVSYFSIGWCDQWEDKGSEWIVDFRQCNNGVFIDYWDDGLFLVSYLDGERTVAPIHGVDLTRVTNFRIAWISSLVILEVDGEPSAFTSSNVPLGPLPFSIAISNHRHMLVNDNLVLDHVRVYNYDRSPKPLDPQIVHLWPNNESSVFIDDTIDFHLLGGSGSLYYSWDDEDYVGVDSPWDVPVPEVNGDHTLHVKATNDGIQWSTGRFVFHVRNYPPILEASSMPSEPIIDGLFKSDDASGAAQYEVTLRNECREDVVVSIALGFTKSHLYVAMESPVSDTYHSRATLYIDGNADGFWNDNSSDACVTCPSPSGDPLYDKVERPHGTSVVFRSPEGFARASATQDDVVFYEFMVSHSTLGINISRGIGLGIRISHGGINLALPRMDSLSHSSPLVVKNDGVLTAPSIILYRLSVVVVVALGVTAGAIGNLLMKRETFTLEQTLRNERLERVKLLLFSHERISIDRVSRMIGSDSEEAESLIVELLSRGFPAYQSEGDVIRVAPVEKKEKGV
ncbi:MAG: hypothetical protein JSW05_11625 [Candidatus Thorarchaeota archaeon]|nr:MAG: hypothetical protein JSW05_11625 [Candidatus Thorarchaeota archaeon]